MFALWAVALSVFAQNSIYVCKTDGTFEKFAISDVDSICFSDPKLGEDLGYQWVDLGLSVKWATYNVGGTDTLSYGDFYAWGEVEPKSAYNKANYAFANLDTIITTYDSLVLRLPQADTIITIEMDTTINDTDYYSYNELTKILDVNDFAATKGFVRTVPIDNTLEQSEYKNYKLRIGQVDPKDIIDEEEEEEEGEEENADDLPVPDTSGGDNTGKKPDTGAVTNTDNKSEGVSILPIIAVVSVLAYVVGRKYVSRRKINW